MKWAGDLLVIAALVVVVYVFFTDGCKPEIYTGEVIRPAITHRDSVIVYKPSPVRVVEAPPRYVLETVFDTVYAGVSDSVLHRLRDSLCGAILDSLAQVRTYSQTAKDSLVAIDVGVRALGYVDSIGITWQHTIPEVRMPDPRGYFSLGLLGGTDTSLATTIQYTDKRRRSYIAGYELIGRGFYIGATIPLSGKR